MKLGIVSRLDIPEVKRVVEDLMRLIGDRAELVLESALVETYGLVPGNEKDGDTNGIPKFTTSALEQMDVDYVITVGGDGTILRTLNLTETPLLTIDLGNVGFLAEVAIDELDIHLDRFFEGHFFLDVRRKLMIKVNGKRLVDATNEAVLNTPQISKMKHFRILVDNFEADRYRSDGLIVSTPTGTTCYAMSAGAPILDPRVPANVIVPLAPFRLAARPIVVPAKSEIEVETLDRKPTLLVIDGEHHMELKNTDVVTFRQSEHEARFVRFEQNFYRQVWRKLAI